VEAAVSSDISLASANGVARMTYAELAAPPAMVSAMPAITAWFVCAPRHAAGGPRRRSHTDRRRGAKLVLILAGLGFRGSGDELNLGGDGMRLCGFATNGPCG